MKVEEYKFEDCQDCKRHGSRHCNQCDVGEFFDEKDSRVGVDREMLGFGGRYDR